MILDLLERAAYYAQPGTRLARAFDFLRNEFDSQSPDGRIDVAGDDIFALVQAYPTRPLGECRFEAHRKYIDIQLVLSGGEGMGWAPVPGLEVTEPYDPVTDAGFFALPSLYTTLQVLPGTFALFRPHDAHMPQLRIPASGTVRKVVMKVLAGE